MRVKWFELLYVLENMISKDWKLYEQLALLFSEKKQGVTSSVYVWNLEWVELKIVSVDIDKGK